MINLKRVQDLEHIGDVSENSTNNYVEITRYNAVGSYNSLRISMKNFLDFFSNKLSTVRADDQIEYVDGNMRLGTLFFASIGLSDDNYIVADGKMYTDVKKNQYKNVSYVAKLTEFVDMLEFHASRGSKSIVCADISEFQKYRNQDGYRGKYVFDRQKRIVSFPNIGGCLVRNCGDTGDSGNDHVSSMPNVSGFLKTCYHGFASSQRKQKKVIQDIGKLTGGVFSVSEGEIDKNYVNADLDLSNQNEKYGWITDIGQVVDFDASRCSSAFQDGKEKVEVDCVRYVPYILISNRFVLQRRTVEE